MAADAPVHLALLWHMHQPWYVDSASDEILLPWVRLNAASAYTDMARLLLEHAEIRACLSISPCLLDQLELYEAGASDVYEELTLRPADELTPEERTFLLRHFFSVDWERVLPAFPRYTELLDRRGRERPPAGWDAATHRFAADDLRDLQVLFNLAWLGRHGRQPPQIQRLIDRGRGFTEADKQVVLGRHRDLLCKVMPTWRRLAPSATTEIVCTPYYGAILPLLIDSNVARRPSPEALLPERFAFPADAETQLARALERLEQVVGVRPRGLWPAQGGVSPELVQLAVKLGLTHLVTDSDLLFHSLDDRGSTPGRRRVYQPFRLGDTTLLLRSHGLCERLIRHYPTVDDAEAAADELVAELREVGRSAVVDGGGPPLVVLALDGENVWQPYPDRGVPFLEALYRRLEHEPAVRTVTLAEHLASRPPAVALDYLHSGSTIESNFAVWIGDQEKNRAWNLLARARKRLDRSQLTAEVSDEALERAQEHILRAECGDWMWWLGEPFSSAEDLLYQALFRGHLMATYRALGDSPPADLTRPIERGGVVTPMRYPTAHVQPRIDGTRTSFHEWRGAGYYRAPAGGSVFQEHAFIAGLYWGFDPGRLFVRLDPVPSFPRGGLLGAAGLRVWLELSLPDRKVTAELVPGDPPRIQLTASRTDRPPDELGHVQEVACWEVLELAIPLSRLGLKPGQRAGLTVHFARDGQLLSTVPSQGVIELEVPGDELGGDT